MLIDLIGYGMTGREDLSALKIEHGWDKVLLIDPLNPFRSCEIESATGCPTDSKIS